MKEDIINALLDILRTQGLKFTMDDLVRRMHISKSTLYQHFSSKDVLLESMVEYFCQKLDEDEEEVLNNPESTLEEKLIATISVYPHDLGVFQNHIYQYLYNLPNIRQRMMVYNKRRFDHFNVLLDEGVAAGQIREDLPRAVFFQLLLLAQRGMMDPNTLSTLQLTYVDATNVSLKILLHGIMAPTEKA